MVIKNPADYEKARKRIKKLSERQDFKDSDEMEKRHTGWVKHYEEWKKQNSPDLSF